MSEEKPYHSDEQLSNEQVHHDENLQIAEYIAVMARSLELDGRPQKIDICLDRILYAKENLAQNYKNALALGHKDPFEERLVPKVIRMGLQKRLREGIEALVERTTELREKNENKDAA